MSQTTHKFIVAIAEDRLADADALLKTVVNEKVSERIRKVETELDEGIFDRFAAKGAGAAAKVGALAKNFGTKVAGGASAAKSAVTGDFKGAAAKLGAAQDTTDKNDPAVAAKKAKLDSIVASVKKDLDSLFPNDPGVQDVVDALTDLSSSAAPAAVTPPPLPSAHKRAPHPFSKIGKSAPAPKPAAPAKAKAPVAKTAPVVKKAPVAKPVAKK
jgi:hypothetical protein